MKKNKKTLEGKIVHHQWQADQQTREADKYLAENKFIHDELEKLKDPHFLTEEELAAVLTEKHEVIAELKGQIKNLVQSDNAVRRQSAFQLQQRNSQSLTNPEEQATESEESMEATSVTKKTSNSESLRRLLDEIMEKWDNHLSGVKKDDNTYHGQEEIMKELLPFLESALHPDNDIKQWATDLLDEWENKYPNWVDLRREKHWLKMYLEYYDYGVDEEDSEEIKDQVVKLEVNNKALEESLTKAKKVIEKKNKEWLKLTEQSSIDLKKAVKSEQRKYKTFINPKNPDQVITTAKTTYQMSTKEEVNKAKIPLQVWEETFDGQPAELVKKAQEKLKREKEELAREKEELKQAKEKLANDRRKFFTDLQTVEAEFNLVKEERENMEEEKEIYLEGFNKAKKEASDLREKVDRLIEMIYSLGGDPDTIDENNDDDSAEDGDDNTNLDAHSSSAEETDNENNDDESLKLEETKSTPSTPRSGSPVNSELANTAEETNELEESQMESPIEEEQQPLEENTEQTAHVESPTN